MQIKGAQVKIEGDRAEVMAKEAMARLQSRLLLRRRGHRPRDLKWMAADGSAGGARHLFLPVESGKRRVSGADGGGVQGPP